MKLGQLIDGGSYSAFGRMADENRHKHIDMVNYIAQAAIDYGVNIADWDILGVFGTGKGNHLKLDRRAINKILADSLAKGGLAPELEIKEEPVKTAPPLEQLNEKFDRMIRRSADGRLDRLKADMQNCMNTVKMYQERLVDQLLAAAEYKKRILKCSNEKVDIAAHIRDVVSNGFWEFHGLEGDILTFRTKEDIVCRHIDKTQGINIKVNLGRFEAHWLMSSHSHLTVGPLKDNLVLDYSIIHPHVSGGDICWGNAADLAHNMIVDFDIKATMQLLANLLCDYCNDNPYALLYDFLFLYVGKQAIKAEKEGKKVDEVRQLFVGVGLEDKAYESFISIGHSHFTQEYQSECPSCGDEECHGECESEYEYDDDRDYDDEPETDPDR